MENNRDIYDTTVIHKKLKQIRLYREYEKQIDVTKKINVSRQTYSLWELGKRVPSIFQLAKLANFFQVDISFFIVTDSDPRKYDMM